MDLRWFLLVVPLIITTIANMLVHIYMNHLDKMMELYLIYLSLEEALIQ